MSNKKKLFKAPLVIGLTGSIGSGESTVARIFEMLGAQIYDSDLEAKQLMNTDKSLKEKIIHHFGQDSYSQEGQLDRPMLAKKVFNAPIQLEKLNQLVHPAVGRHFKQWILEHQHYPVLIKEAAILFESKANKGLHQVVCVIAPRSIRMERVVSRDSSDKQHFEARERNQWPESQKAQKSHALINNDGEHSILQQAHNLWNYWLSLLNQEIDS